VIKPLLITWTGIPIADRSTLDALEPEILDELGPPSEQGQDQ